MPPKIPRVVPLSDGDLNVQIPRPPSPQIPPTDMWAGIKYKEEVHKQAGSSESVGPKGDVIAAFRYEAQLLVPGARERHKMTVVPGNHISFAAAAPEAVEDRLARFEQTLNETKEAANEMKRVVSFTFRLSTIAHNRSCGSGHVVQFIPVPGTDGNMPPDNLPQLKSSSIVRQLSWAHVDAYYRFYVAEGSRRTWAPTRAEKLHRFAQQSAAPSRFVIDASTSNDSNNCAVPTARIFFREYAYRFLTFQFISYVICLCNQLLHCSS
ncbi:hypothetical protein BD779DRAFT_467013 [Infundibulicybe gibba]|nr:hypothetical protein BD779DRAFT_467013 [Infundibulicybe gibba]